MSDRAGRKQSGRGPARGRHRGGRPRSREFRSSSHSHHQHHRPNSTQQRDYYDQYRPEPPSRPQPPVDITTRSRDYSNSRAASPPASRDEYPAGRLQRLLEARRNLELQIVNTEIAHELQQLDMERDSRSSRRYDDGEVTRYGAGESYRPFNDRTPRRAKSPERERRSPQPRERVRSPPLEPRELRDRPRSPPREPRERLRSPPREPRERPRSPPREPRERPRSPPREPRDRIRSPPREPRERPRSPPRGPRARSPLLRDRPRSPPIHDNRYIPDRTPRRRSRSPFRPDRSRDRARDEDRGLAAADTWRRRERSRSPPVRRPSPRRSPIRRNSPPPRRFSPLRRDIRDDRDRRNFNQRDPRSFPSSFSFQPETTPTFGRHGDDNPNNLPVAQSKRMSQHPHAHVHNKLSSDYQPETSRRYPNAPTTAHRDPDQRQDSTMSGLPHLTSETRYAPRNLHSHRDPRHDPDVRIRPSLIDIPLRVRSRSGDRDRRDIRDRDRRSPPPRRISPPGARNGPFRRRSPSMDRRDDRFNPMQRRPSPPRESAISSTFPSRDQSRRQSPAPLNGRRDDRSNPQSPGSSRPQSRSPQRPVRERSPIRPAAQAPARSPPRGPAAARPPPTGPRGDRAWRDTRDDRDSRNFSARSGPAANDTPNRPAAVPSRQDAVSPGVPPAGPRGYGSARGGYGRGGGRGNTWNASVQSRNLSPAPGPAAVTTSNNTIPVPTGPRGHTPSATSVPSTPTTQPKPFNPPKGPAAEKRQLSVFEKEVATMTPIIQGGKMSVEDEAAMKGVLPEQLAHFKAAEEEADRFRKEIEKNEEKTRAMMVEFRKGQRECEILKLRTDLTEAAVARSSGDSFTGSAF